jgi:hypothetical protein
MKMFSDLVGADKVHVVVPGEGDNERTFIFDRLDGETHRQYTDIYHGRSGRRRGDTTKATRFLFKKKCVDVQGLTDEEKQELEKSNQTAKDVLLADSDYALVIDAIIGRYLLASVLDTDTSKSS